MEKSRRPLFFFFCRWALTLPPCFDKEATSALWLTSHGAPPDCRKLTGPGWAWGSPTPYRNGGVEYCEELPPLFASGPAR